MNQVAQVPQMTAEAAKILARHQTIETVAYYAFAGFALWMLWGPSIRITTFKRNKKEAK